MQRHPVLATVAAAAFILILAAPALVMKLSMPDESAQARGTMGYASYATMAQGFGPGFDAPLHRGGQGDGPRTRADGSKALHRARSRARRGSRT